MSVRITDYGMDAVATAYSKESWMISYIAVGTGSAEPSQSDTALEAEVARTNSDGGFSASSSETLDSATSTARSEYTAYRVFDFTSSYNLTEYGHFMVSSGGSAVFRDLFRQDPNDPNSQPVTISVQAGDQLQIIVTVSVVIPWEEVAQTVTFTVPGGTDITLNGTAALGVVASPATIADTLWPGYTEGVLMLAKPGESTSRATAINNGYLGISDVTRDSYVAGSYTRRIRGQFGTADGNGDIGGWAVGRDGGRYNDDVFKFILDTPFTKDSTHILELLLDVSWSRG